MFSAPIAWGGASTGWERKLRTVSRSGRTPPGYGNSTVAMMRDSRPCPAKLSAGWSMCRRYDMRFASVWAAANGNRQTHASCSLRRAPRTVDGLLAKAGLLARGSNVSCGLPGRVGGKPVASSGMCAVNSPLTVAGAATDLTDFLVCRGVPVVPRSLFTSVTRGRSEDLHKSH